MKLRSFFFLAIFAHGHYPISAQSIKDTRTAVLNNSELAITDSFSLNSNISSSYFSKSNVLEVSHHQNYFVKELSQSTLQYQYGKLSNQLFKFGLNYSGNVIYNSIMSSLGYARKITEKINLGVAITHERFQYAESRYNDLNNIYPSISLFVKATPKIDLACLIINPFRSKIAKDLFTPGKLIGSIAYSVNKSSKIGFGIEQKSGQEIIFTSGIDYQFTKIIVIRSAYVYQLSKLSFGTRIFYQKIFFDIGFSNQLLTGNSASFSFLIPFSK